MLIIECLSLFYDQKVQVIEFDDSDKFYLQIQEKIHRVPGRNMVFLIEYFNTLVSRNRDRWYPSLGKFAVG